MIFVWCWLDLSHEEELVQRLAELQVRLQYLEAVYRARQEDVAALQPTPDSTAALAPAVQGLLRNMTGKFFSFLKLWWRGDSIRVWIIETNKANCKNLGFFVLSKWIHNWYFSIRCARDAAQWRVIFRFFNFKNNTRWRFSRFSSNWVNL